MSKSMMKLIFPDGKELFIMSDGINPTGNKLHETPELAREASPELAPKNHLSVLSEEVVEVEREIETSDSNKWEEAPKFYCRASYFCKVITYGPSYGDEKTCPEW